MSTPASLPPAGGSAVNVRRGDDPEPLRWLVLPVILGLATFLRFFSLTDRGIFDSDQGRDFLVLRHMLVDGVIPLVGPPASVGGVHHGVAYYYLLAPLAWLSNLDPIAVAGLFAAAGVLATYLVWWLARDVAGPAAGLVAGLVYALSPTAIEAASTTWNPNLIGLTATLTLAAAWRAWTTRRARWWALAIFAAGLTVQLHIVASLYAIPIVGLLLADLRRSAGGGRRALVGGIAAGLASVIVLFVPLLVHELTTDFSEVRHALAFLAAERGESGFDPLTRFLIISLRMASYPVVGLIVDSPVAASLLTGLVVALMLWRLRAANGPERTAIRVIVAILVVASVGLTFIVPDLSLVIRGLPNDHYHEFTDPLVAVILGLGVGAVLGPGAATRVRPPGIARIQTVLTAATLVGILAVELVHVPATADPNGGWPAALVAAQRIAKATPATVIEVIGLPQFKPTSAVMFPLLQVGREVINGQADLEREQAVPLKPASGPAGALVIVCDRIYAPVLPGACGGEAEATLSHPDFPTLIERFDLSPRTSISVYGPAAATGLQ